MKLAEEQKQILKKNWGDWVGYHGEVDEIMRLRLKELDPEFLQDLDKETEGATFWYA
jgi:hypothetical protein